MMGIKDVTSWTAQQLHDEYKLRKNLIPEMLGWLYPRVLRSEMAEIEKAALDRHDCHPNQFIERGLATMTASLKPKEPDVKE